MSNNDLLSFTKRISGIDLINYIVNFTDHNMIIYRLFKNNNHDITIVQNDDNGLTYKINNLTIEELNEIRKISNEQDICIYNTIYKASFIIPDNNHVLISIR